MLVVLFGAGGLLLLLFWRTIPEIWLGQIWMAVATFLPLVYVLMTVRAGRATELANTGVRGRAHMLEMTQTGTYINNQPRVKLRLLIEAPGCDALRDRRHRDGPREFGVVGASRRRDPESRASPARGRGRASSRVRSRSLRVIAAARSNSVRASSKRPSLASRSPRTLGNRW
ncbi:MAG: hypothetical protein WKF47_11980 [Geodermatophilaceae bacterium]